MSKIYFLGSYKIFNGLKTNAVNEARKLIRCENTAAEQTISM